MWQAWMLAASLAAPTAIIDSVRDTGAVHALQLVRPGERIDLGPHGRIRIAYFSSCVHESIRGGWLRVGVTASLARAQAVERVTAECRPPAFAPAGAGAPAAMVLRDPGSANAPPARRLRTRTPVLLARPGARIVLERIAPYGRSLFITMESGVFDFAAHGLALDVGDVWRACSGENCLRVWVDPNGHHDRGPVLERVIAMP